MLPCAATRVCWSTRVDLLTRSSRKQQDINLHALMGATIVMSAGLKQNFTVLTAEGIQQLTLRVAADVTMPGIMTS